MILYDAGCAREFQIVPQNPHNWPEDGVAVPSRRRRLAGRHAAGSSRAGPVALPTTTRLMITIGESAAEIPNPSQVTASDSAVHPQLAGRPSPPVTVTRRPPFAAAVAWGPVPQANTSAACPAATSSTALTRPSARPGMKSSSTLDRTLNSVSWWLIGQRLDVRFAAAIVEFFVDGELIKAHQFRRSCTSEIVGHQRCGRNTVQLAAPDSGR